jgi:lysozyme family protein
MLKKTKLAISISLLLLIEVLQPTPISAASFDVYFSKLMHFEGNGFGIDKPTWGNRTFSKNEAYRIHKNFYWNRFHGNLFNSQEVAEVLIDQLINAGEGKNHINIKAFEAIIGVPQDGILSVKDVEAANKFLFYEQIVNPYVNYRLHYYRSRSNFSEFPGWAVRAKTFLQIQKDGNITADALILPKELEKEAEPPVLLVGRLQ